MSSESNETYGWLLRCTVCGLMWILEVSFDIRDTKKIYHYCSQCKRNTFHEVITRVERRYQEDIKNSNSK